MWCIWPEKKSKIKWIDTKAILTNPILVLLNKSIPIEKTIANQNN